MARPRKTKEEHILGGTFRSDRHGDDAAVLDEPAIPDPPAHLWPEERPWWDYFTKALLERGDLRKHHGPALEILVRCAADYEIYNKKCWEAEVGSKGWTMLATARDRAERRLLKMLREFKLTPATAPRGVLPSSAKPDPFAEFLSGKKPK